MQKILQMCVLVLLDLTITNAYIYTKPVEPGQQSETHKGLSGLPCKELIGLVAVEVRMRTLDRFFKIAFSTYYDITSLCLSLYHVLE